MIRIVLVVLGCSITAATLAGAATVLGRSCPGPVVGVLQLTLPLTTVVTAIVAVVAGATGETAVGVAAGVVAAAAVAVLAPRLRTATPPPPELLDGRLTVVLANLYLDNAEPDDAVDQLLHREPDVIVMTELTDDLLATFDRRAAGRYPRRVHPEPLEGEYEPGIFVADHVEVHDLAIVEDGPLRSVEAVVDVAGRALRIVTVHPEAPTDRSAFRRWRSQLAALRRLLDASDGPTIALGDLNAGTLQVPYEDVTRRTRFRDAHDLLGVSLRPSWGIAPALPRWVPTLVARLDHLLVSPEVVVTSLDDLDPVGSDHRPFVAEIALRDDR